MKIAFEGIQGAHSQAAVEGFLTSLAQPSYPVHPLFSKRLQDAQTNGTPLDQVAQLVPTPSISDIFNALSATPHPEVDFGFIPIENTVSGTFVQVYDQLMPFQHRVHIVGEWVCHQSNFLMVLKDSPIQTLADIEELYSHQHVLEQCKQLHHRLQKERSLKSKSRCLVRSMEDTATAASYLQSKQLTHAAVIGNALAAERYGLRILMAKVEDDPRSATRYLILSNQPLDNDQLSVCSQTSKNKTSLAVSLKNAPGQLFRALSCFALRDLNITKMESRPSPRASGALTTASGVWEYVNYMDIEGGTSEVNVRNALQQLQEFASQVRVLGSYPRFNGTVDFSSSFDTVMGGPYGGM